MKLQATNSNHHKSLKLSRPIKGKPLNIGEGFKALSFKHDQFSGMMDPLVMLDHYTMSRPTFGAHPHAGMSALSILFEDSKGVFNNRDSLGNNIGLLPGDAYWLKAGIGVVHDEKPTEGSRTHGLQIFVNLPQRHKQDAPTSRHVTSSAVPVITGEGFRVRVVLGESNGTQGPQSPALPLTALDAFLDAGGEYTHEVDAHQSLLVYAARGHLTVHLGDQDIHLPEQHAIAMQPSASTQNLHLASAKGSHFVVLQSAPVHEPFVQKGPFVMSTMADIQKVTAAYEAGQFGPIAE